MSWLKNNEFIAKVDEIWRKPVHSNNPVDVLNIKLKRFKKYFKGWGSHMFGHSKKRKKELMDKLNIIEELEESDPLSPKGLSKHGLLPENC